MGIWSRLLAAPITLRTVLVGRAVSGALIALGLLCVIFGVAVAIFHIPIGSVAGFLAVAGSFALMVPCFGLFIAAFGKTPEAARGIAVFATLLMVMLGGAWVPSFLFPEWLQTVSLVMPTRWAVDGFDAMTWRGLGLDAAMAPALVQLGFAAGFAAIAFWRFGKNPR
jgi:ABC-2 type transport system permease protein